MCILKKEIQLSLFRGIYLRHKPLTAYTILDFDAHEIRNDPQLTTTTYIRAAIPFREQHTETAVWHRDPLCHTSFGPC